MSNGSKLFPMSIEFDKSISESEWSQAWTACKMCIDLCLTGWLNGQKYLSKLSIILETVFQRSAKLIF